MSVKDCPLHDGYRFKTCCEITSCKFYTERTKHKCMSLDTVFAASEKGITDAELSFLKFPEVDKKAVYAIRKHAQDRVYGVILLYHAAQKCKELHKPDEGYHYVRGESAIVDKVVESNVWNIPILRMEHWMLRFIFDKEFMQQVSTTDPKLHILFDLKPKELDEIRNIVTLEA